MTHRYYYLDILRFLAILGVVLIHVASFHFFHYGEVSLSTWLASDLYHSAARWCIPIFFMISGVTLLAPHKKESLRDFFSKRYLKLLLAYLFWQLFYFAFNHDLPNFLTVSGWQKFLLGESGYHLWYLQAVLVVYPFIPLFRILVNKASQFELKYFIIIWLIFSFALRFMQFFFDLAISPTNYILDYSGYLILGYYLNQYDLLKNKSSTAIYVVLLLLSIVGIFLGNWFNFAQGGYQGYWNHNLSILVLLGGGAIFCGCKNLNSQLQKVITSQKIAPLWRSFSQCSFGIYLIHLFVLTCLHNNPFLKIVGDWPNTWLGIPLLTLLIFCLSWLLIIIIKKIPLLKKVV